MPDSNLQPLDDSSVQTATPEIVASPVDPQQAQLFATTEFEMHQGPLPKASEFGAYESCLKGSANRILKMAEKEQDASIMLMKRDWFSQFASMILGKMFLYALLGAAIYLVAIDKKVEGLLAGIAPVVTVLYSTFSEKKAEQAPAKKRGAKGRTGNKRSKSGK